MSKANCWQRKARTALRENCNDNVARKTTVMPKGELLREQNALSPEGIELYFARYMAAFSSRSVEELMSLWRLPALAVIASRERIIDANVFRKQVAARINQYVGRDFNHMSRKVWSAEPRGAGVVSVRAEFVLYNSFGYVISRWDQKYVLTNDYWNMAAIWVGPAEPDSAAELMEFPDAR